MTNGRHFDQVSQFELLVYSGRGQAGIKASYSNLYKFHLIMPPPVPSSFLLSEMRIQGKSEFRREERKMTWFEPFEMECKLFCLRQRIISEEWRLWISCGKLIRDGQMARKGRSYWADGRERERERYGDSKGCNAERPVHDPSLRHHNHLFDDRPVQWSSGCSSGVSLNILDELTFLGSEQKCSLMLLFLESLESAWGSTLIMIRGRRCHHDRHHPG